MVCRDVLLLRVEADGYPLNWRSRSAVSAIHDYTILGRTTWLRSVRRGMATYIGKDVSKMKAKGGGKWKYMPEKDMLEISSKFSPYR
jgi:hypothetical protein